MGGKQSCFNFKQQYTSQAKLDTNKTSVTVTDTQYNQKLNNYQNNFSIKNFSTAAAPTHQKS